MTARVIVGMQVDAEDPGWNWPRRKAIVMPGFDVPP